MDSVSNDSVYFVVENDVNTMWPLCTYHLTQESTMSEMVMKMSLKTLITERMKNDHNNDIDDDSNKDDDNNWIY